MLLEPLEAEELGANRLFQLVPRNGGATQAEPRLPAEGRSLQFSDPKSLDRIVSLALREALRPSGLSRRSERPAHRDPYEEARYVRDMIRARAEADEQTVERGERA